MPSFILPVLLNQSSPVGFAPLCRPYPQAKRVGPAASETPDPAQSFAV